MLLGYLAQGCELRETCIRENNVEPAFLSFDLCEEAIQIVQIRYVSLYSGDVLPDLLDRRSQLLLTAPGDENVRAFVHKLFRCRQADAAVSARDQCNLFL